MRKLFTGIRNLVQQWPIVQQLSVWGSIPTCLWVSLLDSRLLIIPLLLDRFEILSLFHFKELHGAFQGLVLYSSQAEGSALRPQSVSRVVNRRAFKDFCAVIQHNYKDVIDLLLTYYLHTFSGLFQ